MSDNAAFEKLLADFLKAGLPVGTSAADVQVRISLTLAAIGGLAYQGGPGIGPGPHRFPKDLVGELNKIYSMAFP